MEIFSAEFASALLAIIIIDLVLAGDNAIVIALVARRLPRHLQRMTIIGGTIGAVVVRVAMTLVIVWLLNIPGLLLAGGVLLVWIAYKLLAPNSEGEEEGVHLSRSNIGLWGAIRTIIIADAVMGMDNVLGVAGAARGQFSLVVIGLLISIPIMILGSTLILKWVERYPVIIYFGAGVLGWTAATMISGEPLLADIFAERRYLVWALHALIIAGIVVSGLLRHAPIRAIQERATQEEGKDEEGAPRHT